MMQNVGEVFRAIENIKYDVNSNYTDLCNEVDSLKALIKIEVQTREEQIKILDQRYKKLANQYEALCELYLVGVKS